MDNKQSAGYPDVLLNQLPEAHVAFEGARAWIMQSENTQLVFFTFEQGIELPSHNHTYAQWGVVIDGEMDLLLNGEPHRCRTGDEYLIPPGVMHGARFYKRTRVMDFFSEKRYKPK
ncbi:cupin domain-containing protein [Candidatus Bathyarchaeota archaeon]|nr:cupin domain-containing protein [Candidatus Bathyarchaeota archaeon]